MWNEYEDAYVNLGDLLIQMNETEQAEKVFMKLLEFAPRNENGLYNVSYDDHKKILLPHP